MAIEVGAKLEGKVTGITNFGAFVDLSDGVTGLVHISEIADNYVKDVKDHLKLDDVVTVKVINVDKDGKIGLSIKQATERPAAEASTGRERTSGSSNGEKFNRSGNFDRNSKPFNKPASSKPNFGKPNFGKQTFEDKMSKFLKDSDERISSLKKNTEGKRGGRGAKRM